MEVIAIGWNILLAILSVVLFTAASRDQHSDARDKQFAWASAGLIVGALLGLVVHLESHQSLSKPEILWVFGPLLISVPLSIAVLVMSLGSNSDSETRSSEK